MKLNATEFFEMTGRHADNDDLVRCDCNQVGTIGHHQCGICTKCELPRFICGCVAILTLTEEHPTAHGVGSTPVNKKSSTPLKQKTAKAAPASLNPILTYTAASLYIVEWDGYSEVFAADSPNSNNYLSKQAETKAIAVLSVSGFRPAQPLIWVRQWENRWMLVPQNEWKDDTTDDSPSLGWEIANQF